MTKLLLLSLVTILVACSNDSSDSPGSSVPNVPTTLQKDLKTEMSKKSELTAETKAEFKKHFYMGQKVTPPLRAFVFSDSQSDDYKKAFAKLNSTGKKHTEALQKNCSISKAAQPNFGGEPQAGQTYLHTAEGTINGAQCGVDFKATQSSTTIIHELNKETRSATFSVSATETHNTQILDQNLQADLGIKGFQMALTTGGRMKFTGAAESSQAYVSGNAKVTGRSLEDNVITMDVDFEVVSVGAARAMQVIFRYKLTSGEITLGYHSVNDVETAYVNGVESTKAQVESEYGVDFEHFTNIETN